MGPFALDGFHQVARDFIRSIRACRKANTSTTVSAGVPFPAGEAAMPLLLTVGRAFLPVACDSRNHPTFELQ
jgi:hypothetical protein